MEKVFLVQSVNNATFRKLAKGKVKTNYFDCSTQVTTLFACRSKKNAVDCCRNYNHVETQSVFFVNEVCLY